MAAPGRLLVPQHVLLLRLLPRLQLHPLLHVLLPLLRLLLLPPLPLLVVLLEGCPR